MYEKINQNRFYYVELPQLLDFNRRLSLPRKIYVRLYAIT